MVENIISTNMSSKTDIVNSQSHQKPEPTRLCRFSAPITAAESITQTAQYAKDPKTYLEENLGKYTVERRKDLLCIPSEVDKDIYGNGNHKTHFQQHTANLFDKEAGLFFITGVQAQLAALKIHCQRAWNDRVAWHVTSHLESAEERAFEELYRLERRLLGSIDDENATVEEIKQVLSLPKSQRPAAILVELPSRTLGCKTYTFYELEAISSACKENGVRFHLDGARIWEIEPYYRTTAGKTFADIARLFDTVYVSFYKGLRSSSAGAMLLGDEELIREAKVWQRRAGGNAFALMYEVIDCERGYNENIGTFGRKWEKMSEIQNGIMAATGKFKTAGGKRIVSFVAVPATCCQVRTVFLGYTTDELVAARDRVEDKINVRVFERIRPKKTVDEMNKAERASIVDTHGNDVERSDDNLCHEIEWLIGPETLKIETKVFVDAYVALCEELVAARKGGKD